MYKLVAILLTLFFIERFIEGKNSPVSYTTSKSTVISFKPETTYAPPAVNDSFIDSIFIGGISTSNPLYGWQVDVHYDSDAVHSPYCMEGPFMKSNGATSTIFVFSNNIDPYFPAELIIGGSLGPGVPKEYAVSGSGYVCKIIWKVKSGKNSVLDITRVDNDTWWMDTCLTKFLFDTEVDGYFKWSPSMIEEPKNSKTQNPKLEMDVYPNPFSRRTTIDIRL
ncbi:MAG: cohesin domain-containing protein, partial [bacterium]|nr:cohesin domain-containing protein [bacterium]